MDKGGQGEKSRVVIDASVVVKWVIPGEPWEAQAKALVMKLASGEIEACAPPLLFYEVTSVILKSMLTGTLTFNDGIEALKVLGNLGLNVQTINWIDLAEILRIATITKLTIYDSAYLHLSKKVNAQFITADVQLKQKGENVTEIVHLKDLQLA
jgi:predicted nucleic acid-binding protein